MTATPAPARARHTGIVLFGCLFAAQSSLVVLSPILSRVAADLGVSTATAGQLRAISGVVAGAVAVGMVVAGSRYGLREVLAAGLGLLTVGTLTSASAPGFAVLAAAQVIVGVGLALVLSAGLAAAAAWAPAEQRSQVLSWALIGQPAAWIVGMPLIGVIGEYNWRLSWLIPAAAGVVAVVAILRRERDTHTDPVVRGPSILRRAGAARWSAAELLAYGGWAGMLVYAGALFIEVHRVSIGATGLLLGVCAAAYLPGNFLARRWVDRAARPMLIVLAPLMAIAGLVLCIVRPSVGLSVVVFALFAFLGGARTIAGSALGIRLGGAEQLRAMSLRTVAVQFGYLAGAGIGGLGLAAAGWSGLGVALAAMLAASAVLLVAGWSEIRARA